MPETSVNLPPVWQPLRTPTPRAILAHAPQPWPLPRQPWVMRQTWHKLLFAHWPVAPATLSSLLPPQVTLDTFAGQAWVGVVPFVMSGVRPRGVPSVPWLSGFPEINVRTYVTAAGKPGVWFLSLDAGNPIAVRLARSIFFLPYFDARFSVAAQGEGMRYESQRTHRGAAAGDFRATYGPVGEPYTAVPGSIEHFLTERYCLYTTNRRGQLLRGNIRHASWPLQPAEAAISVNTLAAAAAIALPDRAPLLHFARRLDVLIWWEEAVKQGVIGQDS